MTASRGAVEDGSFGRMAAIAAMVSLPVAAGNLLAMWLPSVST